MVPDIDTARLRLRRPEPADAAAIIAGVGDLEVARWLAVVPHPYAPADADWFIGECQAGRECAWAIHDAAGLAGIVSLNAELGYWLARDRWGRGYAREAAAAVVAHGFAAGRDAIIAGHFVDNLASARVLEALGFRPVGLRRKFGRALGREMQSREMRLDRADWRGGPQLTLEGRGKNV